MLDKQLAKRLAPLVHNKELWSALKDYLNNLKNLELQALAVATSESEMFRFQGRLHSLVRLEQLEGRVKEALSRKDEV
jgi:hypothetical protein